MPEHREGYYDYMLRRTKEENAKSDLIKNKTQEIQKENYRLNENANIHNN